MAEFPTAQSARSAPPLRTGDPRVERAIQAYWRRNVRLMLLLLSIWAAAGLGAGVLFADTLSSVRIGGFPLGFWFAQQGSIVVFVLLILVYALAMNRMDRRHHEELAAGAPGLDGEERPE